MLCNTDILMYHLFLYKHSPVLPLIVFIVLIALHLLHYIDQNMFMSSINMMSGSYTPLSGIQTGLLVHGCHQVTKQLQDCFRPMKVNSIVQSINRANSE